MIRFLLPLCFAVSLCTITAQTAAPVSAVLSISLPECLDLALQNSAQLKKAKIDRQSLEQRLKEGRSAALPKINVGVNVDYYPMLPTNLLPGELFGVRSDFLPVQFGQPWQFATALTIQQPLYDESLRRAAPVGSISRSIYDLLITRNEEEVIFNTASVFYQLLQAQQLMRAIDANHEKLSALQKMGELQLKNGYATATDLKRLRVAAGNLEGQRQNLLTGISALRQTLQFLCGLPFDEPFNPQETISAPAADSTQWLTLGFDPAGSTENRLLLRNLELNKVQTGALRAENFPKLSAFANGLVQNQRNNANFFANNGYWFGMAAVGFKVDIPVFNGFRRHYKSAQLKLDGQKLEEDRKQLLRAKQLEFRQAREQLQNALRTLHNSDDNIGLAREISEKLSLQYKEGVAPLTDLLNAQTAQSEAETNYWQQVFNYKLAVLKLLKAAGQLDALKIR